MNNYINMLCPSEHFCQHEIYYYYYGVILPETTTKVAI